jgi:hypothetical protein
MKVEVHAGLQRVVEPGEDWARDWAVGFSTLSFWVQGGDYARSVPADWKPGFPLPKETVFEHSYLVGAACSGYLLYSKMFGTYAEARAEVECLIPVLVDRARRAAEIILAPLE